MGVSCHVAGRGCLSHANLDSNFQPSRLGMCFRCGEETCSKCSSRRKYINYGVVRLCDPCQEEFDGTAWHVVYRHAVRDGFLPSTARVFANQYPTPRQIIERENQARSLALLERQKAAKKYAPTVCQACGGTGRRRPQSSDFPVN